MATIIKRIYMPLGPIRREIIYVNNVSNDDVVKPFMQKLFSCGIMVVNQALASYTNDTSVTISASGGRDVVTIRDPDGSGTTIYEIDVTGQ